MNRQPKTIKQLNKRLEVEYIGTFPFGKHKDRLVADVVKSDPNYVVWWHETIRHCPLDKKHVDVAYVNYQRRQHGGYWTFPEAYWDRDNSNEIGYDEFYENWY